MIRVYISSNTASSAGVPTCHRVDHRGTTLKGKAMKRIGKGVALVGMLAVVPFAQAADFTAQRELCLRARAVYDAIRAAGIELDTLSLGMSADLEAAVSAGSTMVRIGTAIFGRR